MIKQRQMVAGYERELMFQEGNNSRCPPETSWWTYEQEEERGQGGVWEVEELKTRSRSLERTEVEQKPVKLMCREEPHLETKVVDASPAGVCVCVCVTSKQ